jgi:hypothetical protein
MFGTYSLRSQAEFSGEYLRLSELSDFDPPMQRLER